MKRSLFASALVFLLIGGAVAAEQSMLARVTVYWASGGSGSDKWTRRHVAASGARLRTGHCAVDPRRIPYGSKVSLPDGTLVAVDTGGSVRNRRAARRSGRSSAERNAIVIDRFFETKKQALSWARQHPQFMTVRVSSKGGAVAAKDVSLRRPAEPASVKAVGSRSTEARAATTKLVTPLQPKLLATAPVPPVVPPSAPRLPLLRNSISTPRTQPTNVVSTSPRYPAAAINSAATDPTNRPAAPALPSGPRFAANTAAPNSAPAQAETRSHYGRAVAYLP